MLVIHGVLEVNLQLEADFFGSNEKRAYKARSLSVLVCPFKRIVGSEWFSGLERKQQMCMAYVFFLGYFEAILRYSVQGFL
jgi:hypothetical protein